MKKKIEQLFDDNSMPKMVLLNGAWGSGKTYWIENNLIESEGYIYLSLNGLASIDDFYSNLISKFFLNKNISATDSSSLLDGFQKILGNFNGENKGLISGLVSGFKGAAVTKAISSIKNKIIVLDDLERIVSSNFAKEIVGICQNLSEKNENLKFIFATNIRELKFDDKHSLIEKNFAGIVEFELSRDNFLEIVHENLEPELRADITRVVEELELKNIRIIKRAKNKYLSLMKEVEKGGLIDNLDLLKGKVSLLRDVMKIYFMLMGLGCDVDKIKSQSRGSQNYNLPGLTPTSKEGVTEEGELKLPDIASEILVDHIASSQSLDFREVLRVYYPIKILTLDLLLQRGASALTDTDDSKINEYVKDLLNIIKQGEPELLRWFCAVDVLNELHKYNFIGNVEEISTENKPLIESIFEEYIPSNFKTSSIHITHRGYQPGQFHSDELNQKFESILAEVKKTNELKAIDAIEKEIHKGWTKEVDMKIYNEYRTISIFSTLKDHECFVKAVSENWTVEQIHLYSDFITDRYKANLTDWLMDEFDFLQRLKNELSKVTFQKSGIKIGMINQLIEALVKVLNKMKMQQKV